MPQTIRLYTFDHSFSLPSDANAPEIVEYGDKKFWPTGRPGEYVEVTEPTLRIFSDQHPESAALTEPSVLMVTLEDGSTVPLFAFGTDKDGAHYKTPDNVRLTARYQTPDGKWRKMDDPGPVPPFLSAMSKADHGATHGLKTRGASRHPRGPAIAATVGKPARATISGKGNTPAKKAKRAVAK